MIFFHSMGGAGNSGNQFVDFNFLTKFIQIRRNFTKSNKT